MRDTSKDKQGKTPRRERVKKVFADKTSEGADKHYSKGVAASILSVVSVLSCILAVIGYFWLKRKFSDTNILREWASENPILAALAMILICAVQVIVALIPGEVVEIASGYIFGAWWGSLLCAIGIMLGSICAILIARRFGRRLVESLYPKEKLDSLPVLRDPSKRNAMTAILFLIPGTPKDLMTYIIGLTEMSIPLYLLLTMVCRFPSILMSAMSGSALGDDRLKHAIIIFIITGVVSALGYLLYHWIQKHSAKKHAKHSDEKSNEK